MGAGETIPESRVVLLASSPDRPYALGMAIALMAKGLSRDHRRRRSRLAGMTEKYFVGELSQNLNTYMKNIKEYARQRYSWNNVVDQITKRAQFSQELSLCGALRF